MLFSGKNGNNNFRELKNNFYNFCIFIDIKAERKGPKVSKMPKKVFTKAEFVDSHEIVSLQTQTSSHK